MNEGKGGCLLGLFDSVRKLGKSGRFFMDELEEFYKENRSIVYMYFYNLIGSSEESEELTQETFYQAVKSIHRFKGQSTLKTWLLQIARNTYRNHIRALVKGKNIETTEKIDLQKDETYNPQKIFMQRQTACSIQHIFEQMPADYRDVLIFKEVHGLSHVEIAQILDKTPQTTKVLLYRAKRKFKALYENEVVYCEKTL
jgi:RNA polymerase sigma-70 factor (ECF subfamily)